MSTLTKHSNARNLFSKPPQLSDIYHQALMSSWKVFLAGILAVYCIINLFFAFIYMELGPEGLAGIRHTEGLEYFWDCFFFSVQTFSTIGYGGLHPIGWAHNVVVAIQAFMGMVSIGLISGLIYARFSRPIPKVLFSKQFLITNNMGERQLIFRMANARQSQIVDAQLSLYLIQDLVTPEGNKIYHLTDLELKRSKTPVFFLSWLVMHKLDEKSPLFNFDIEQARAKNFQLLALVQGQDSVFHQNIHARHSYFADDCVFDHQFEDMVQRTETGSRIDIEKLSILKSK